MSVRPAVICQGLPDSRPDPAQLVPAVLQAANSDVPELAAALRYLYDGSGAH
jgi:hypothetical protein